MGNMRKTTFILYSLLLFTTYKDAQATPNNNRIPRPPCAFVFVREEEFLSLAEKAENLEHKLKLENIQINKNIAQLQSEINQQISSIFERTAPLQADLIKLRESIESLEEAINKKTPPLNKTQVNDFNHTLFLDDLIRDPAIVQANKPYRIDWLHHPQPTYIFFSPKVIDIFFHPKKDIKTQFAIVRKNLKALQLGYAGKHGDAGIKILTVNNKVSGSINRNRLFEIKTFGKISGHIRWGGFIDGNSLYVVHYANNTHHNRYKHSFMMTLLDKLRAFHSRYKTTQHY